MTPDAVLFEDSRLGSVFEAAFMISHRRGRRASPDVIARAITDCRCWMQDNGAHGFYLPSIQGVPVRLRLVRVKDGWLHVEPWRGHTSAQLEMLRGAMFGRRVLACRGGYPGARGGRFDCEGIAAPGTMRCKTCDQGVRDAVPKFYLDVERHKRDRSASLRKHAKTRP